jgi:adenine-specific DNA-methyltransferase
MVARKYGVVYTPDRLADFAAELLCSEIEESKFDNMPFIIIIIKINWF